MQKRIEQIKNINDSWMESELYSPASDERIKKFEDEKNILIP